MPSGKISTRTKGWITKPKEQFAYDKLDKLKWFVLISFFRWYPDRLDDIAESKSADYSLAILQRVYKRAMARHQEVFITGSRGTSKTYCTVSQEIHDGTVYPRIEAQHVAPTKEQSAELVSQAYNVLARSYPKKFQHWTIGEDSAKEFSAYSKRGSKFESNATSGASRGLNTTQLAGEEVGQEDVGIRPFNHQAWRSNFLPTVRYDRTINQKVDTYMIPYKKIYITSGTSKQNDAYTYRKDILEKMRNQSNEIPMNRMGTSIVLGNSWKAVVLSGIRQIDWALDLKKKLTPEEWLREMESVWTGTAQNAVVSDTVLTRARTCKCAEFKHCELPYVHYCIGYDASYSDGKGNAKCAASVIKCTLQKQDNKRDRFLKELVYVYDFPPPLTHIEQAKYLKKMYHDFIPQTDFENCGQTIIAIDAYTVGDDVITALMSDLGDGFLPFSCVNGYKSDLSQQNAIPCILPIRANNGNPKEQDYISLENADMSVSDMLMVSYISGEFSSGNVRLLIDTGDGVREYKKQNGIRIDDNDSEIAVPYLKTKELSGQIANLKKVLLSGGYREERISKRINRDMWSALKYALRAASIIEKELIWYDSDTKITSKTETYDDTPTCTPRLIAKHSFGKRW